MVAAVSELSQPLRYLTYAHFGEEQTRRPLHPKLKKNYFKMKILLSTDLLRLSVLEGLWLGGGTWVLGGGV